MIPARYRTSARLGEFAAMNGVAESASGRRLARIPVPAPQIDPRQVREDVEQYVEDLLERLNHLSAFGAGTIAEPLRQVVAELRIVAAEACTQALQASALREYAEELHQKAESRESEFQRHNEEREARVMDLQDDVEDLRRGWRETRRHTEILIEEMRKEHRSGYHRRDAVARILRAATERHEDELS